MILFCFFGLMNLVFDATDEGVRLCLESVGGEGVSQSCLLLNVFLLFGVSAMMAGRYFQTALSARLIGGQRRRRRLHCRSAVNRFRGVHSRSVRQGSCQSRSFCWSPRCGLCCGRRCCPPFDSADWGPAFPLESTLRFVLRPSMLSSFGLGRLGASVGALASLQGQQSIAAIGLVACRVGWYCCPLLVPWVLQTLCLSVSVFVSEVPAGSCGAFRLGGLAAASLASGVPWSP